VQVDVQPMFTSQPVFNAGVPETGDSVFSQDAFRKESNRFMGSGGSGPSRSPSGPDDSCMSVAGDGGDGKGGSRRLPQTGEERRNALATGRFDSITSGGVPQNQRSWVNVTQITQPLESVVRPYRGAMSLVDGHEVIYDSFDIPSFSQYMADVRRACVNHPNAGYRYIDAIQDSALTKQKSLARVSSDGVRAHMIHTLQDEQVLQLVSTFVKATSLVGFYNALATVPFVETRNEAARMRFEGFTVFDSTVMCYVLDFVWDFL
jgi:hypothetical protein